MTHRLPRIRLVVPTTGRRLRYLEQCLESISRQDEPADVVVVGPTVPSPALHELAKSYRCLYVPELDRGISSAVNQGWSGADVDYLGWLGDDDLLTDGSLSAAVRELERVPDAAMVYGWVRVIDSNGSHVYTMRPGRFASWLLTYGQNFVWQPGSLYRKAAVEKVGMLDPLLRYTMDFDLHLRLRRYGKLHYLPQPLACYRSHPTTLTATNPEPYGERRRVMRRHLGPVSGALEVCWWPAAKSVGRALGALQFRTGREDKAHG
ncbi:glycosyltransferase [Streptomyces sp. NPDC059373]